jgi:hypothetical protein
MRTELWLYPAVEIVHIAGLAILVGSIAMFDLRVLGLSKSIPVRALARHLLPWTLGALLVIVPSGLLMFMAHAGDFISNRAFIAKLTLIFLAGLNAIAFHLGPYARAAEWDTGVAAPAAAKLSAAASLAIWFSVIACGRLLAYL